MMAYLIYNVLLTFAAPSLKLWLRTTEKHRKLLARFHPPVPAPGEKPLWVHACSVGEVNTAAALLAALQERFPDIPLLLTTSTQSGNARAAGLLPEVPQTWFPVDRRGNVRRFLREATPRALILIETELWPNVVRETRRAGVPVVVVNGRLSDKHFDRYVRYGFLFRQVFGQITHAAVEHPVYAQRFAALGTPSEAISITGNAKFDAVATAMDSRVRARLRALHDFAQSDQILVFGSTRPGDETLAAACWHSLRQRFPQLRLVVAPRHLDRAAEAAAAFDEPLALRSELAAGRGTRGCKVLLLDTTGELAAFYSLATVAVIGGSFLPGVDGHNPLEPAALGVATVFGPYMNNFREPASVLLENNGAIQVPAPDKLVDTLGRLLEDPGECRRLGTRGRAAVMASRGAVARNVDCIARVAALAVTEAVGVTGAPPDEMLDPRRDQAPPGARANPSL